MMKSIVCLALLLAAQGARAELFELKGRLTCGYPTLVGSLDQQPLSTSELIAHALSADADLARDFALVYDSEGSKISLVRRCDGSESMLFASNQSVRSTTGPPRNGTMSYAITQLLDVADWDVSVELGTLTCNFSGLLDANSAALLTAKGTCAGALTITDGEQGYCSFQAKLGKPLEIANDCPT